MSRGPIFVAFVCGAISLFGADPDRTAVREAFESLYDFDFSKAHSQAGAHIARYPDDPMGYAVRAAIYLFSELDRLGILASEFFADDRRIASDERLDPDPGIRQKFFASVDAAEQAANSVLAREPKNAHALFALTLGEGMKTDYSAFIEKKRLRSLSFARQSHKYARELLKIDPNFVDAYLTAGLTEYLVGSLPFFLRWFVRFDGVEGDKKQAEIYLKRAAEKGRYLGPFAEVLLCVYYLREKQPRGAILMLEGLSARYPSNRLFRDELRRLRAKYPAPELRPGRGS
jgi:hypothetical protein